MLPLDLLPQIRVLLLREEILLFIVWGIDGTLQATYGQVSQASSSSKQGNHLGGFSNSSSKVVEAFNYQLASPNEAYSRFADTSSNLVRFNISL